MFQLGTQPISYNELFQILFQNAEIKLDSTVEQIYTQKEDKYQQEEINKLNKQQTLVLLLQMLNQPNCTSYQQIQNTLDHFYKSELTNDYIKTELDTNFRICQTPKAVSVAILYQIIPIFILSTSLFNEAACCQCKLLTLDFSIFKSTSLKYICQGLASLCMNSKKVNLKKEGKVFEQTLFILEQANDFVQANRLQIKNLLSSGSLQVLSSQELENSEKAQFNLIQEIMNQMYNISCFRQNLIKTQFKSEKGIWRAIDVDGQYQQYQQQENKYLPQQFVRQIMDEFYLLLDTLVQATTNQKCFIGQYNNELLLQQSELKQYSITQLSHFAQGHLQTHATVKRVPQQPLGTRDIMPQQYFMRQKYINKITNIFQQHGAVSLETPVFESTAILTSKYGDDEALIYNLQDFGETPLSLRYDLTVPFARFCVTHNVSQIKRFQLGKVYRRDKPDIKNGRFREFYQLDFDIGGGEKDVSDAEVLCVVGEVISLFTQDFEILVNSRPLLNNLCIYCKIPNNKFKGVCSCIDALDKVGIEGVKDKLINQKGIDQQTADLICQVIQITCKGIELNDIEIIKSKLNQELFVAIEKDLRDLLKIFEYIKIMNPQVLPHIVLDFSLARGLEYYTGMVFEAKLSCNRSSISAGGRYDHLLSTINPSSQMNTVGGSIGIERLFAILESQLSAENAGQERELDVYICSLPGCQLNKKLEIYGELIRQGLHVGMNFKNSGSLKSVKTDLEEANNCKCICAVMVGGQEIESNKYGIKNLMTGTQEDVDQAQLGKELKQIIGQYRQEFKSNYLLTVYENMKSGKISEEEFLKLLQ